MFIISTKNQNGLDYCVSLVEDIRRYHKSDLICIVDSNSEDKSYFEKLNDLDNVVICDIKNSNYCVGAYWFAYSLFPNEAFYFCFHDTIRVKANLDYLKNQDFVTLFNFERNTLNVEMRKWCVDQLKLVGKNYKADDNDLGVYGPIWMCKNWVMKAMVDRGFNLILPETKSQLEAMERIVGFFIEDLGLNISNNSLYGDILQAETISGRSGVYPHTTSGNFQ